jgi:hypothetical protein
MRAIAIFTIVAQLAIARATPQDDLRDGDRHFEAGDWARAATAFDRAIAKAPGQVSAEAYGKRAAIFIIRKDHRAGLEFIARAKLRHPGAPEVLEQEALLLWETDRKDEAIAVAERVVVARPETFTNQKLIGEYHAARDPARTAVAYAAYLAHRPAELEPGDVLPRVRLAFAYLALARASLVETERTSLFGKAAGELELVQRKHGKRANAQVNVDNGLCAAYTGLARFDQAVTACERATADRARVDATGSAWFNLATAYLARKQPSRARGAALEFTRLRKTEARGAMLVGDTYFAEREWGTALDHYTRAEALLRGDPTVQAQLSIRLGKTYRRLPGQRDANLALAIDKLAAAYAANPTNGELALELGAAYLEARQDAKAAALADKLLASAALADATRSGALVISGKALFNQRKLVLARQRLEAARALRPGDVAIRRALVLAINEQAFEAMGDPKAAQAMLEQGLAIDPGSALTLTNLAVLAIERGACEAARPVLGKLEAVRGHDHVLRLRLLARSHLCGRRDPKRASELYAAAEKAAKQATATLALAEIYTEWAPLLWDADLAGAIEKLELAVQVAARDPGVGHAAKRNLALALYRRGWNQLGAGKAESAANDFARALRDVTVLADSEPLAFELALALALLDANRPAEAAKLLDALAAKGNQAGYLRPPYAKVGAQFLAAYARYRAGGLAARQQAAAQLARLEPELGARARPLLGAVWEAIAYDQWKAGQLGAAQQSLATAEKHATGDAVRRIQNDRIALSLDKRDVRALEAMNGVPAESLVNLGIVYDRSGRPRDAYDAWQRARARGVQLRELGRWIEAKKRIYGY